MSNWKLTTKVQYHLDAAGLQQRIKQAQQKPLEKCAALVLQTAKGLLGHGGGSDHTPSLPDSPPNLQTGALRSSIQYAKVDQNTYYIGPVIKYGGYLEHGAHIRPVSKQWLTIPVHPMSYGKAAADFDLYFVPSKNEKVAFLFLKEAGKHRGKSVAGGTMMFLLVKNATISPRPFMRPAMNKVSPQFPEFFSGMLPGGGGE